MSQLPNIEPCSVKMAALYTAEIKRLQSLLASKTPVCPHCQAIMQPVNYRGYYDEFAFWSCNCEEFDNGEKQIGAYA